MAAALRHPGMPVAMRDRPPARRAAGALMLLGGVGVGGFAGWALTSDRAALVIAVLVVVYVLPGLILLPIRIRRARRRATATRAKALVPALAAWVAVLIAAAVFGVLCGLVRTHGARSDGAAR